MVKEIIPGIYQSSHSIYNIQSISGYSTISSGDKPTNVIVDDRLTNKEQKAVCWGVDNNHPNKVIESIRKTGVLGAAIYVRRSAHFGTGLTLYKENDKGEKQILPYSFNPDFKAFDRVNFLNNFYVALINDLEVHDIGFPEYVVSRDFSKINLIRRQKASFCRFEEMNPTTGRIEHVYLNANWEAPNHDFTKKVPCFNFMSTAEEIREYCEAHKIYKFIIPVHYTMNDEVYYPKPFWQAPFRNGWLEVVQSVPAVNKSIQENQLHFKFLISISEEYFKNVYGDDWDTFTPQVKKTKYTELVNSIDDHLSGPKAGGSSLTAPMYKDMDGKLVKSIVIEPIDDKLKEGAYLPSATAGNSEILFAKQVDPSLIGQGIPGGKNLSGSGSDKREAYTILCASLIADRMTSLLPFYFLRDWNQWGDDIDATFPNVSLTTLDKNPTGNEIITN